MAITANHVVRSSFNHRSATPAPRRRGLPSAAIVIALALAFGALAARIDRAAAAEDAGIGGAPVAAVKATLDEAAPVFANTTMAPAERQKKLREIAARRFDFTYMARSAMGTHWKTLTPAQRKQFVPIFTDYVMDTYLSTLQQSTVDAAGRGLTNKVTLDGSDLATVYSVVKLPSLADPLHVNYALRRDSGGWMLYDIVVDDVSTMANYRDEFNKTMNGDGYDKLIGDLKRRTAPAAH